MSCMLQPQLPWNRREAKHSKSILWWGKGAANCVLNHLELVTLKCQAIWVLLLCLQTMEFLMHTIHPWHLFKQSTTGTGHMHSSSSTTQ